MVKKKGYTPVAAKEILMPNIFQKRKSFPEKEKYSVEKGKIEARKFCNQMLEGNGRWFDIPVYSWLISIMYRRHSLVNIWKRLFPLIIDGDKCTKCGICIKLCPEKCLIRKDDHSIPICTGNCSLCQRCFEFCPSNAIRIGNKNKVIYRAVSLNEMLSETLNTY